MFVSSFTVKVYVIISGVECLLFLRMVGSSGIDV